MTTIHAFDTEEHLDLGRVGGKALNLITTTRAGFRVPEGVALSVAFFEEWTDRVKATASGGRC